MFAHPGGPIKLGIDFGTTNSAVAALTPDGTAKLVPLRPGQPTQRTVVHASLDGVVRFGTDAFETYLAQDLTGRFLRSIKAFLPQDVPPTHLVGRRTTFVELVALYLRFLVEHAEEVAGEPVTEVVVGRPVTYHQRPEKHAHAVAQFSEALDQAALPDVRLQLEPVAAARRYEAGLSTDRIVLVGDFGGGTADFAVLCIGPSRVARDTREDDVLGTSGVPMAGDVLDGRFVDRFVRSELGEGDPWLPRMAKETEPFRHPVYRKLSRLYDLHHLRDPELERFLKWVVGRMDDATGVKRLRRLVFDDLGYPMAGAIERAKVDLCATEDATFRFVEFYRDDLDLQLPVTRADFAAAVEEVLSAYDDAIDEVLAAAQVSDADIDEVFLTGGTSQLPFLRARFADRFGADALRGTDVFTSVCEGLALS